MNPIGPMGKMGPSATCAHICLYGPMGLMRPHGPMYVNKFTHICEFNGGPNRNLNTPADSIGSQTHPLYSTITEGIAEMQEQLEAHRSLLREGRRAFMARESALTDAERRMYLDPSSVPQGRLRELREGILVARQNVTSLRKGKDRCEDHWRALRARAAGALAADRRAALAMAIQRRAEDCAAARIAKRSITSATAKPSTQYANGGPLAYATPELQADKDIVMAAVSCRGAALQHASQELKADKEVVLAAVSRDKGMALQFASAELQSDRQVVLAAVTCELKPAAKTPRDTKFASAELQSDRQVVLAAVTCELKPAAKTPRDTKSAPGQPRKFQKRSMGDVAQAKDANMEFHAEECSKDKPHVARSRAEETRMAKLKQEALTALWDQTRSSWPADGYRAGDLFGKLNAEEQAQYKNVSVFIQALQRDRRVTVRERAKGSLGRSKDSSADRIVVLAAPVASHAASK
jgi:hypothetical protein